MSKNELTDWWICSVADKCKSVCHTGHSYPHQNEGKICTDKIRCSANNGKITPCRRLTISEYAAYRLLKC